MSKKMKSIGLLILGIFIMITGVGYFSEDLLVALILVTTSIVTIFYSSKISKKNETITIDIDDSQPKLCKYCKTEIKSDAKVCPHCRKTQDFSFGRVMLGLLIGLIFMIIIFYLGFVNNNDAPLEVRRVVCELGLRNDYPYCYYIDTDKLNEILNK